MKHRHSFTALALLPLATSCAEDTPPGRDVFHEDELCQPVAIASERPADLMAEERLAYVASRMPCIADTHLAAVLESADTMFYDATGIAPGYQDSFGDDVVLPLGMRPNSIEPVHIDLAVPGGHGQIFEQIGVFHFPFGRPTGVATDQLVVIDFWHAPRDDEGELLPVVHWTRSPSGLTRRVEWVFPVGTVFGELLFLVGEGGHWFPFEVRTRTRERDGWTADAMRPFPRADDLAERLELVNDDEAGGDAMVTLIEHLRDPSTLQSASLSASHYAGAFDAVQGAVDVLPDVVDPSLLHELMRRTAFSSSKDVAWKENETSITYAPTATGGPTIVPPGYNGGLVPVTDDSCDRCHRDAGRPFRDYYPNIIAYGELWGQDEVFTWHPFRTDMFLGADGDVVNFNNDNRRMRQDFVDGGLLAPFSSSAHSEEHYTRIPREWHDYVY